MAAQNIDANLNHANCCNQSGLDILAEAASQQPYLPVPEPPAPGVLVLVKAAAQMSHADDYDSAEEVIEVRPLERVKTSTSSPTKRSPSGVRKHSAKSRLVMRRKKTKKMARNETVASNKTVDGLPSAFELPFPSLYRPSPKNE